MLKELTLPHGSVKLPAFFPDGTRGTVKCVDAADLEDCRVPGIVMNTYHLLHKPGQSVVKALGGLNGFMNWNRPILTDSGGFQVFSLIRENAKYGRIGPEGITFRPENGRGKSVLTPESCIRAQFNYGSDIMMCLDYCTHPDDGDDKQELAVDITVKWAERCKKEYSKRLNELRIPDGNRELCSRKRPLLFGIIQGGGSFPLRRACAQALIEIGFDGFGFGGWPLTSAGELTVDILEYTASLMPDDTVKYAMGIGRPEGIALCHKMGYELFDCVIPTREARHNRLYVFSEAFESRADINLNESFYDYYYLNDDKYRRDSRPVSRVCDCRLCTRYTRAYLRHLADIGDPLAARLGTMHNLRFYTMLMEVLSDGSRSYL